jgi:ABC-type phosphate transport system substrate-binding protein
MSFKKTLIGASALAVIAAFAPHAEAATPATTLYAGGGTLAAKLYRDIFNCYSATTYGIYYTSAGNVSTIASYPTTLNAACLTAGTSGSVGSPTNAKIALAYEPVGSGAGQNAIVNGSPTSFGTPATTNSVAYINSSATVGASATPYPEVEFIGSDAYLSTTQIASAALIDTPASAAGTNPVFVVPTLVTPITLPIGQVKSKGLLISDVCKIFSGLEKVPGNTAPTQQLYVRADGSGTSFIFSDFLANNCSAYTANFSSANGFPSTTPNWTAAASGSTIVTITAVSGSGGIANAVAAASYSIGYDSPDYVNPVVTSSSAYPALVGLTATKEVTPTYTNVQTHVTAIVSASTYPKTYNNNIGSTINNLLASSTYAGTKAKGAELKALLTALIPTASANPNAQQLDTQNIIEKSGFSPLIYPANTTVATLLYSAGGPFYTTTTKTGAGGSAGIGGVTADCPASLAN